jgi:transcriptional regulator with XRE-family HTH domain
MGSPNPRPAFNKWLQAQLRAKRLTQRQLAQKSGVDHSTVSRLLRGERVPSLRTAAMLARGLGWPEDVGRNDDRFLGASSPTARVEYALRLDELLDERGVRAIMDMYLAERVQTATRAAASAKKAAGKTPVPIVTSVGGQRPASRTLPKTAVRQRSQ